MSCLSVGSLRCEYRINPIGIDITKPRFSWVVYSDKRHTIQSAYRLQVALDTEFSRLVWDTGKIVSDRSVHVEYNGEALLPCTRYFYRVCVWAARSDSSEWSPTAWWETGFISASGWKADWITPDIPFDVSKPGPCPMLRKNFTISRKVKSARIYATALGLYELYLNGQKVGDRLLTPGWTSYSKRLQYQTYDVTEMLGEGENAVGAILGDGWYKGYLVYKDRRNCYGDKSGLLLQLHVVYEDGGDELVVTDTSWKSSTGPLLQSDIYMGEIYDARLEKDGWNDKGYNDQGRDTVKLLEYPKSHLVGQETAPVKVIEKIKPMGVVHTPKGETVIDMGQNMVGFIRFEACGEPGTVITFQHAEVLDREGNFYTDNLRSAAQKDIFILRGGRREAFAAHFTFHGFRYVKVEGFPGHISLEDFEGHVIHTDMEPIGSFKCSDPLVNQLQHNILWSMKGNFVDLPTDCPQRDERLGWTGDAQMFIRTASYLMDADAFFTKWLKDLKTEQLPDGGIPFIIPDVLRISDHSSAAWGDAAVICPWTIYQCYGDERILAEQYGSMKAWVEYIRRQGKNEYLWNTGAQFGDWLGLDAREGSYDGATAKDFIATAFYAYSTSFLVKAAEVLGKNNDVIEYKKLYKNIVKAFRDEFITPSGRLSVPTQTAHVLALMFNLMEEKHIKRTLETLAKLIEDNKTHLTTGFIGTPYLCHVLSRNGRNDLAYRLLLQKDYPSWLYQVEKGATTIWEHWDGIREDGSFWSPDMNSFNHYAYGSIGDWLYRVVGGIDTDPEKPGYKHILIHPMPGEGIDSAEATLCSMYGKIRSCWSQKGQLMEMEIIVPCNTTASLFLDGACTETLKEGGKQAGISDGILKIEKYEGGLKLELGSGDYTFSYLMQA